MIHFRSMRCAICFSLAALCGRVGAIIPQDLVTTTTPLGRLAFGLNQSTGIFSADNSRLAFAGWAGDLSAADRGNLKEPEQAAAQTHKMTPIRMYVDGVGGPATTELTGPVFSLDSQHVGYALKSGATWRVLVDGKPIMPDADAVSNSPVNFSPDSQHTVTIVQRDYRWIVSVDGRPWPTISDSQVDLASFSPDGKHVVAIGHTKNTAIVYLDGVALTPLFDQTLPFERLFPWYNWRPDSGAIGFYGAFPEKHWQVFTSEIPPFESVQHDAILRGSPVFSPDSSRFAYGVQAHGKWTVIVHEDPTPSLAFEEIAPGSLVFLAPGESEPKGAKPHLLYIARQQRAWQLYRDQQPVSEPFDQLVEGTYIRSLDQRHFALAVRRGKQCVLIRDGKSLAIAADMGNNTVNFSPDGRHVASAIRIQERWRMAIDGAVGETDFSAIAESPPAFSPDGRTVAYAAALNPGAWRLYVGANADFQSRPVEGFLPNVGITWRDNTHLVTIAVIKKVAQRLEAAFPP